MNKYCLRRLVLGSRRVSGNMKTNNRYVCDYNSSIIQTTDYYSFKSLSWPFGSHYFHPGGGSAYKFAKSPTSIHSQLEEYEGCYVNYGDPMDVLLTEELDEIEEGDTVNLSQLLFTKKRDYLLRYHYPLRVTADQLSNKVVVLYFLDRNPYSLYQNMTITSLIDVYNDLKHKNCFEVVFVYVADVLECDDNIVENSSSQTFEDIFSCMPWTAIPYSDSFSRNYLTLRFRPSKDRVWSGDRTIVVDPTGLVLSTQDYVFSFYGSLAFPFTEERIATVKSEIYAASKQPSVKTLLVTPERDYVISNKGEKIPIQTLEDKVVALLFYEDGMEKYYPIEKLKQAYEELRKNNENFEVVLVYLTDTYATYKHTNKETYQKTFKTMPWLALPFKDPIHKKLERLFAYPPDNGSEGEYVPRIVILGPHGDYVEPYGAEILSKFGVASYPFTRENLVKLDTVKVMDLKLEMLCRPTAVFKRKDGFQVHFSQLLRKRVILCLDNNRSGRMKSWLNNVLKKRYLRMKGTCDEFEVIYFPYADEKSCLNELSGDVSWFVSSPNDSVFLRRAFAAFSVLGKFHIKQGEPLLLAFGEDGKLVRRSLDFFWVDQEEFPFYAGSMEKEAYLYLDELMDTYDGLVKNSWEEEENYYFKNLLF